jgi:hypothetical protein
MEVATTQAGEFFSSLTGLFRWCYFILARDVPKYHVDFQDFSDPGTFLVQEPKL